MKRLLAIFTLLILTACAAPITVTPTPSATMAPTAIPSDTPPPTVTPTSTVTLTSTPSPTITPSPTNTATLTPTFGPSPTPSLTPTLASWIEEDFLFGGPMVEGCELPCWQGLTPGVSTAEETEQIFLQAFGYNQPYGSIAEAEAYSGETWPLLDWAGRGWLFDHTITNPFFGNGTSSTISVDSYLNRTTKYLAAIQFRWRGLLFDYTPARFIKELGQPSQILTRVGIASAGHTPPRRFIPFILTYEELGVTFFAVIAFPDQEHFEVCLDGTFWNGQNDGWERKVILSPISNGPFPTIEEKWLLLSDVEIDHLSPFEEVMGITLEEVTQQIQSGGSPCWLYPGE